MKYSDFTQKKLSELQKTLGEKQAELQKLRFKVANDQDKSVRKIRVLRKEIAQILTVINSGSYVQG